jgi:PKD repeat protein
MKINFKKNVASSFAMMGLFFALILGVVGCQKDEPKPKPVASFEVSTISGTVPLKIQITNTSENATRYEWNFGDGQTSNSQNPSITYTVAGNYTITLKAIGDGGEATATKVINVSPPAKPIASFTTSRLVGIAPLTVRFSNTSTNSSSYLWDFGNGQTSTAVAPPDVTYVAGTYTIRLTARNSIGESHTTSVTIAVYPAVIADIRVSTTTPVANKTSVSFSNPHASTVASYKWDLGELGATSTSANPTYVYKTGGKKTISLIATGAGTDVRTATLEINVSVTSGTITMQAAKQDGSQYFTIYPKPGSSNLVMFLSDKYPFLPMDANTANLNTTPYLRGSMAQNLSDPSSADWVNPNMAMQLIPSNEAGYVLIMAHTGRALDAGDGRGVGRLYWGNLDKNNNWQKFKRVQVGNSSYFQNKLTGTYITVDF